MATVQDAGTFWDVTRDQYDADETCLRSSHMKSFIDDRELYAAENITKTVPRRESTPGMRFGTSFHGWLLEGVQDWVTYTGKGSKQTNEYKDFKAAHAGRTILDVDEHNTILRMTDAVRANPTARELVEAGGFPESAGKWQDEKTGVWCKCLWDRLLFDGTIIDIKTVGEPSDEFFARQVRNYGYDISAGFYMRGRAAILGTDGPFKFITVCTEPVYRVRVRELDPIDIEVSHRTIDAALEGIAKCRESGDWSDPEAKVVHTVQIPGRFYGRG